MRLLFKFMMPICGIFLIAVLCYGSPKPWIVVPFALIPFALISVYLSAAELQIQNHRARYRRFLTWKELPKDVTGAVCLPLPALGCIRFGHYLPPLGLLFYIVEREEGPFRPFDRTALMQAIVSSRGGEVHTPPARREGLLEGLQGGGEVRLKWILIGIGSMVAGALMPEPHQPEPSWTGAPGVLWDVIQVLNQPVGFAVYALLLIWFLIRTRLRGIASVAAALLLGSLMGHLVRLFVASGQ
jgi:hypothetical protein